MHIRVATADDAAAACAVLRRSIHELCIADHQNDPATLDAWLANKTVETVRGWITSPQGMIVVAMEEDKILGVGGLLASGEITLNYVSPDARFRGVSKALLAYLETAAKAQGLTACTLVSTQTARPLYLDAGYRDTGPAQSKFGKDPGYRMAKELAG